MRGEALVEVEQTESVGVSGTESVGVSGTEPVRVSGLDSVGVTRAEPVSGGEPVGGKLVCVTLSLKVLCRFVEE